MAVVHVGFNLSRVTCMVLVVLGIQIFWGSRFTDSPVCLCPTNITFPEIFYNFFCWRTFLFLMLCVCYAWVRGASGSCRYHRGVSYMERGFSEEAC